MPNRLLREGITTSDKLDRLSVEAELFYYRLLVAVDDFGRADARPAVLVARTFPLRPHLVEQVPGWLLELEASGVAVLYQNDGKALLELTNFDPPRAQKSKHKGPKEKGSSPGHPKTSANICAQTPTNVPYSDSDSDTKSNAIKPVPPAPVAPKSGDHPRVVKAFTDAYQAHNDGAKPTWNKVSGAIVKSLLASHPAEEIIRRIGVLFSQDCPDFVARGGRDLKTLSAHFDKLAAAPRGTNAGKASVVDEPFRALARSAGVSVGPQGATPQSPPPFALLPDPESEPS